MVLSPKESNILSCQLSMRLIPSDFRADGGDSWRLEETGSSSGPGIGALTNCLLSQEFLLVRIGSEVAVVMSLPGNFPHISRSTIKSIDRMPDRYRIDYERKLIDRYRSSDDVDPYDRFRSLGQCGKE
ncbi:hypothetical protein VFPPC_12356 [Pochonia chlamydosporia 170]|uniref:Uncharacterized protein n=1 Tax=Pochonia chlamydosporia 170 TaxID=1380566 RepID=A0A179EWJ6_METCM|nr:hypothetical protein VFPPC_12356 [Pochonia chlamydosporia 170]OAQ57541.1 hypothetical protein VFPPC_12356 [Pochonia chlamydosporia 170]